MPIDSQPAHVQIYAEQRIGGFSCNELATQRVFTIDKRDPRQEGSRSCLLPNLIKETDQHMFDTRLRLCPSCRRDAS
jgi:hypothetical protein